MLSGASGHVMSFSSNVFDEVLDFEETKEAQREG
jgi:hypothetical protein